jgi:hypothetical protein
MSAKQDAALTVLNRMHFGFGPSSIPNQTTPSWSGYVDTNYKSTGTFTTITGTWNVPEVAPGDCSNGTFATGYGLAGFWVGLDGWNNGTVEQTGTVTECYQGNAYYWDWYEMYPSPLVFVGWVNPGDRIAATAQYTGGKYHLFINDETTGTSNSVFENCPSGQTCSRHSAEVIAEAPGGCASAPGQTCRGSLYLLPNFQWVAFNRIGVTTQKSGGGIGGSSFGPVDVTMVNSAHIKLAVVTKTISKNAFTDSWRASG